MDACCGLFYQKRLRLSWEVDECKPLPSGWSVRVRSAGRLGRARSIFHALGERMWNSLKASVQGLALVDVRAQLEQLQDTLMR